MGLRKFPEPYQIPHSPSEKQQCHPERLCPSSLLECAGQAVDGLPGPAASHWTLPRVIWWIRYELKMPQFVDAFQKNGINGQKLILLNANRLVRMNIQNWQDIKIIMNAIRKLLGVEMESSTRSISLPPRKPMTHFLLYRAYTGRMRKSIGPVSLFRMMGIVQPYPKIPTHWDKIDTEKQEFPKNTIGYVRKPFSKPVVAISLTRP